MWSVIGESGHSNHSPGDTGKPRGTALGEPFGLALRAAGVAVQRSKLHKMSIKPADVLAAGARLAVAEADARGRLQVDDRADVRPGVRVVHQGRRVRGRVRNPQLALLGEQALQGAAAWATVEPEHDGVRRRVVQRLNQRVVQLDVGRHRQVARVPVRREAACSSRCTRKSAQKQYSAMSTTDDVAAGGRRVQLLLIVRGCAGSSAVSH